MIEANKLSKSFAVHKKQPGLLASLRSLIIRDKVIKHAIRDVSLTIGEGEIVGLVGPNGAGKTTLVKMLAGIVHPSSGSARVLGHEPWARNNDFRRQIALIMGQKASLWWDLPAADCFLLLREIYKIPQRDFDERLGYLAHTLQVEEELTVQIRRLSLGERMKMELIATLLHQPRVVFLDEPTIGLDVASQRAIRAFILQYRERHRPAMILTSHYMEDIERLCERVILLQAGSIVFDGPLKEVVERYAQRKIINAHFEERADTEPLPSADGLPGEVLSFDADHIRISVERGEVSNCARALLAGFPVADFTIEEVDIGTVIERVFSGEEAPDAAAAQAGEGGAA
ncbi:MAG: ABC-2 type transport system ATP-binding protein [Planctomycetota bacterium]|jgi:ABC-2 type transport system ATP-binding protein